MSELFDISNSACEGHETHGAFTITIKPTTTDNVAALLHYTEGAWEVLPVEEQNGELTFETETLSPFAIMMHAGLPAADTCSAALCWTIAAIAAVIVIVLIIVILVRKKKGDNKKA